MIMQQRSGTLKYHYVARTYLSTRKQHNAIELNILSFANFVAPQGAIFFFS